MQSRLAQSTLAVIVVGVLLLLTTTLTAQLVVLGDDPDYCYKVEHVKPNLHVSRSVHLTGRLLDQSGAPFRNSPVELRRCVSERKQILTKKVATDADGKFDLGTVVEDDYRLVASPSRAFKQPNEMWCSSDEKCYLDITLEVNATDLPASQCPVR